MKSFSQTDEAELIRLSRARWRVSILLSAVMLTAYFGFVLLTAFSKEAMGTPLVPGLSWGILLGALVIVAAFVLTGVYVSWANRHYDPALAKLAGPVEAAPSAGERDEARAALAAGEAP
jgi:uncharacterized membrane protein (DUF485 family)